MAPNPDRGSSVRLRSGRIEHGHVLRAGHPYSLETFGTWDRGLGWTAERDRCALLVHDLLPYYLSVLDQDLTTTLVDTVTQLLEDAHTHDVPVVASAPRAATTAAQRGLGGRLWGMGPTHDQTSTPALGH